MIVRLQGVWAPYGLVCFNLISWYLHNLFSALGVASGEKARFITGLICPDDSPFLALSGQWPVFSTQSLIMVSYLKYFHHLGSERSKRPGCSVASHMQESSLCTCGAKPGCCSRRVAVRPTVRLAMPFRIMEAPGDQATLNVYLVHNNVPFQSLN